MTARHQYKDTTLQQLRSFYETARLGSFLGAAQHLELSRPTVWQQVHALEKSLGTKLVEPHERGCHLTASGQILVELIGPIVLGSASLADRFRECMREKRQVLTVAASPRVVTEDLPRCARLFRERFPDADIVILECNEREVHDLLKAGDIDLGLTTARSWGAKGSSWMNDPWLEYEPAYQVEARLIAPMDHPLASLHDLSLKEIARYPLVTGANAFPELELLVKLSEAGVFQSGSCRIQAQFSASSRSLVRQGFGVAIVSAHRNRPADDDLCERSIAELIQPSQEHFLKRRGSATREIETAFRQIVQEILGPAGEIPSSKPVQRRRRKS